MSEETRAGVLYFLVVFGVGFLMGPVREFVFLPQLGPTGAVLAETPVLLVAMVLGARWIIKRYALPQTIPGRLKMGTVGLLLVLAGDWFVGYFLRGWTTIQILQHYGTVPGAINIFLFMIYLLMPTLLILIEGQTPNAEGNPSVGRQ